MGSTGGGPGLWGLSPKYPTGLPGLYQRFVTGAPAGIEYGVSTDLMDSGWKWFDGYSSDTGNLVDAKYFTGSWPNLGFQQSIDQVVEEMENSANIAGSFGRNVEFVVPNQQAADTLNLLIQRYGLPSNIIVTVKGW